MVLVSRLCCTRSHVAQAARTESRHSAERRARCGGNRAEAPHAAVKLKRVAAAGHIASGLSLPIRFQPWRRSTRCVVHETALAAARVCQAPVAALALPVQRAAQPAAAVHAPTAQAAIARWCRGTNARHGAFHGRVVLRVAGAVRWRSFSDALLAPDIAAATEGLGGRHGRCGLAGGGRTRLGSWRGR